MSAKYELERDLSQLERMTENLVDYLLGDALYMPVGGFFRASTMPQLSLGAPCSCAAGDCHSCARP